MDATASARQVRISQRKLRLVADLIRGKNVEEALDSLRYLPKKGAEVVEKCLRSVVANAENNHGLDIDSLYVKRVEVGAGPTWKRFLPRAHGRATPLRKRTSQVTIVVGEKN